MTEHLDRSLTEKEDARERSRVGEWFNQLKGKTYFNDHELRCVLLIFNKMRRGDRITLSQSDFFYQLKVQFEIKDQVVLSRLYSILERPGDGGVTWDQWACLMSLYTKGSLAEKICLNWMVYDNTGTGFLNMDDILRLTESHLGPHASDEERNDYASELLLYFDQDKDEKISHEDFTKTITKNPTLLNAFGRVCPESHVADTYLATFTSRYGEQFAPPPDTKPIHLDLTTFRASFQ